MENSIFLAFYLDDENAQRLVLPGGEPPEELHVTLIYQDDMDAGLGKLPAIVQAWASEQPPVEGKTNGTGQFSPGEDGRIPLYANFDAPELPAWRQGLVDHLTGQGYELQPTHGYTPHITLSFLDPDADRTPPDIPELSFALNVLTLKVGDERHDFPLKASNVQETIRQEDDGWHLYSKDGKKHLGGPYPERAGAEERERQVQAHEGEKDMTDTQVIPARLRESMVTQLWPVREASTPFTGHKWEVTIIGAEKPTDVVEIGGKEYIASKNGRFYACDAVRDSAPEWEGTKVYDNHLTDEQFQAQQGMRSVKDDWIGSIVRPRWDAARRRLRGVFKVVDEGLARKLLEAYEQKVLNTIGLSIDTAPKEARVWHEGKEWSVIEGFKKIFSTDLVAEPAAGGGFDRILASVQQESVYEWSEEVQEFILKETREAVREALRGTNGRLNRANAQGLCTPGVQRKIAHLRETLDQAGVALEALESNLLK